MTKRFAMHILSGKRDTGADLLAQEKDTYIESRLTGISVEMLENSDPDKITVIITAGHKNQRVPLLEELRLLLQS
tara:strand:+ start:8890 stop:9114 length:225 start_codon:yes stop_codon:yes gene_type:complete